LQTAPQLRDIERQPEIAYDPQNRRKQSDAETYDESFPERHPCSEGVTTSVALIVYRTCAVMMVNRVAATRLDQRD
jgi:hypothetical protein